MKAVYKLHWSKRWLSARVGAVIGDVRVILSLKEVRVPGDGAGTIRRLVRQKREALEDMRLDLLAWRSLRGYWLHCTRTKSAGWRVTLYTGSQRRAVRSYTSDSLSVAAAMSHAAALRHRVTGEQLALL